MVPLKALQEVCHENNLVDDINSLLDGTMSQHLGQSPHRGCGNGVADKHAKQAELTDHSTYILGCLETTCKSLGTSPPQRVADAWKDDNDGKEDLAVNHLPAS
ncbi:hypothetical protein AVEN_143945-1 [Araneus ventricosus]|uniref:Uncharacterized protein n=1 Tax=Araneus ventricosus TaxID=182803 RepID=A0A4Y2S370_ARAVE|nr:hypothetical protein AVEN_143945-1 [Araneus ventricosus]